MTIKISSKKDVVYRNLKRRGYSEDDIEKIFSTRKKGVILLSTPKDKAKRPHC